MKRKLLTLLIVTGGLALGACQEDVAVDQLIQETELNTTLDPDDEQNDDPEIPPTGN